MRSDRRGWLRLAGLAGTLSAALITFSASHAQAYCRTTTDGFINDCNPSQGQCCTKGRPLYWVSSCVGWSLQKDGTKQMTAQRAKQLLGGAFEKWSSVSCPNSDAKVSLNFKQQSDVNCSEIRYNKEAKNQNVIVFRDTQWDHTDGSNTLGLTTVVFDPNSGEIFDADMELNTADQILTASDPIPPTGYDFESIVTHEAGHFLGLAHSADPEATMYASYSPGSTKMRDLASDDVAGICSVYIAPKDSSKYGRRVTGDGGTFVPAGPCDPEARHGFSTACNDPNPESKGCSVGPSGSAKRDGAGLLSFGVFGAVFALGLTRRTRRFAASTKGK